jgi:hypothetical protein
VNVALSLSVALSSLALSCLAPPRVARAAPPTVAPPTVEQLTAEPPPVEPPDVGPSDAAEPEGDPLAGALVSVRVVGGFMPYRAVHYEVLWRRRVAVASHYRAFVNYDEALSDMKLVPKGDFAALLDQLEALGSMTLPDAPAPGVTMGAQVFEVEVRRAGARHAFKVTEPDMQSDARYQKVIELVRHFVTGVVGEFAFRNVFFDAGTFGFVNLTSVPVAKVFVDGNDTGLETPIYGYELSRGPHALKLVATEEGWEREHTIRVDGGMTTILHIDLR